MLETDNAVRIVDRPRDSSRLGGERKHPNTRLAIRVKRWAGMRCLTRRRWKFENENLDSFNSRRISLVIRKPLMTKKGSTQTYPPDAHENSA